MSPKVGRILLVSGLALNVVFAWWLSYDWVEMIGFSMILGGVYMHKKQAEEYHRYGLLMYYGILSVVLVAVFLLWFG